VQTVWAVGGRWKIESSAFCAFGGVDFSFFQAFPKLQGFAYWNFFYDRYRLGFYRGHGC
jgi:hypothetical protein